MERETLHVFESRPSALLSVDLVDYSPPSRRRVVDGAITIDLEAGVYAACYAPVSSLPVNETGHVIAAWTDADYTRLPQWVLYVRFESPLPPPSPPLPSPPPPLPPPNHPGFISAALVSFTLNLTNASKPKDVNCALSEVHACSSRCTFCIPYVMGVSPNATDANGTLCSTGACDVCSPYVICYFRASFLEDAIGSVITVDGVEAYPTGDSSFHVEVPSRHARCCAYSF